MKEPGNEKVFAYRQGRASYSRLAATVESLIQRGGTEVFPGYSHDEDDEFSFLSFETPLHACEQSFRPEAAATSIPTRFGGEGKFCKSKDRGGADSRDGFPWGPEGVLGGLACFSWGVFSNNAKGAPAEAGAPLKGV